MLFTLHQLFHAAQQHLRAHMRYQSENNNVRLDITNLWRFWFTTHRLRQRVRLHELSHLTHDGCEDGVVQDVLRVLGHIL